jgi:hypothetical protein
MSSLSLSVPKTRNLTQKRAKSPSFAKALRGPPSFIKKSLIPGIGGPFRQRAAEDLLADEVAKTAVDSRHAFEMIPKSSVISQVAGALET